MYIGFQLSLFCEIIILGQCDLTTFKQMKYCHKLNTPYCSFSRSCLNYISYMHITQGSLWRAKKAHCFSHSNDCPYNYGCQNNPSSHNQYIMAVFTNKNYCIPLKLLDCRIADMMTNGPYRILHQMCIFIFYVSHLINLTAIATKLLKMEKMYI